MLVHSRVCFLAGAPGWSVAQQAVEETVAVAAEEGEVAVAAEQGRGRSLSPQRAGQSCNAGLRGNPVPNAGLMANRVMFFGQNTEVGIATLVEVGERSRNSDLGVERSRNSDLGWQARQAGGSDAGRWRGRMEASMPGRWRARVED